LSSSDTPTVRVIDLAKHYGDVKALDGISFETQPGEVFGVLGHNGAGKSTTLRILTGRARPTSGEAEVLGCDLPNRFEQVRAQINLVAEDPTLYQRLSAMENLELFCKLYGLPRSRAKEALERVRLTGTKSRRAKTFSTGMRQRLLLARALLNEPRVLFLDEPTRGLDPTSARDLHGIVTDLARGGATIVLTTHDMHEADELCDRIAFLVRGKIVALDTPERLKAEGGDSGSATEIDVALADGSRELLTLNGYEGSARLMELASAQQITAIHSRDTTLADVFIAIAGEPPDDLDDRDHG
jgi:ABC-2 type transport system ATP-binding protein